MNSYQLALKYAADAGRDFYVNRVSLSRDEEVLLVEPHKDRLCCAIAHPDGKLEYVVQGYSHTVAMTARTIAVLFVAVLCAAFQPQAQARCIEGKWLSTNKALHAAGNAAIVFGTDAALKQWAPETFEAHPYLGLVPAIAASAFVELRKAHTPTDHCEFASMAYDAAGMAIGVAGTRWLLVPQSHGVQLAYAARF